MGPKRIGLDLLNMLVKMTEEIDCRASQTGDAGAGWGGACWLSCSVSDLFVLFFAVVRCLCTPCFVIEELLFLSKARAPAQKETRQNPSGWRRRDVF